MAAYTDVFAGTTAALVPLGVNYLRRRRAAAGDRRTHHRHVSVGAGTAAVARPVVHRGRGHARRRGGGRSRSRGLDDEVPRRSLVIGRTIRIDGVPVTIVGVGPAGHRGTINIGLVTDFWLPIASLPAFGTPPRALARRPDEAAFNVKARLRDGVTVAQAQAAMRILGTRLAAEYPKEDPGKGICGVRVERRAHPPADGRRAARRRVDPARRRRARAGHRLQQPGDAAARARHRAREGSVGAARPRRDARAARAPPADREPAARRSPAASPAACWPGGRSDCSARSICRSSSI